MTMLMTGGAVGPETIEFSQPAELEQVSAARALESH
jgi:hypothetical protein